MVFKQRYALMSLIGYVFCVSLQAEAAVYEGSYSVPIENPAASNPMTRIEIVRNGDEAELRYSLPEDLVGPSYLPLRLSLLETTFDQDGIHLTFESTQAKGTCRSSSEGLICDVKYDAVTSNPTLHAQFLRRKYASDPELLEDKLYVARMFGSDPIGVLEIYCEEENCGF